MGSVGWYVVHATLGAALLIVLSLFGRLAARLRDFDLITGQRETGVAFRGITSLIIPVRVLGTQPIAMVIAAAHVLNKLATDSAGLTERLTRRLATT